MASSTRAFYPRRDDKFTARFDYVFRTGGAEILAHSDPVAESQRGGRSDGSSRQGEGCFYSIPSMTRPRSLPR
jgi:hypothetical protein